MTVSRVVDAPGFVRSEVTRGEEGCEVDLGYDARLWPLQQTAVGPTFGEEELAADKTLALFGRAVARHFVDVDALARRFSEARLVELASAKDLRLSPVYLADALASIDRADRRQFDVDDTAYLKLRQWALRWSRAVDRSFGEPGRHLGRRREPPDIGL